MLNALEGRLAAGDRAVAEATGIDQGGASACQAIRP
jgi:hypothetical protein